MGEIATKHKKSVSDPSHFDVYPDPGEPHLGKVDPDPDPGIHIWEK